MSPRIGGGDRVGATIVKMFGVERCCIGAESITVIVVGVYRCGETAVNGFVTTKKKRTFLPGSFTGVKKRGTRHTLSNEFSLTSWTYLSHAPFRAFHAAIPAH
jgi:hypothetical protein